MSEEMGRLLIPGDCSCLRLGPDQAHMLPFAIAYDGPAPVSNYFHPRISPDVILEGIEVKEAAFRGRKLLGRTTNLPHDYYGIFLEKEAPVKGLKKQDDDATTDVWNAKATFKDITYWRHDDNPHSIDSGHKFFDWLHVASMMHKAVSSEEVYREQCKLSTRGEKRKLEET